MQMNTLDLDYVVHKTIAMYCTPPYSSILDKNRLHQPQNFHYPDVSDSLMSYEYPQLLIQ